MSIKLHSSFAVHPGKWLRAEVVEPAGLNVTALADHLGVSRQSMSKLLNGHQGLSAEMAIRFEKAFGLKADTLLRMQAAWALAEARAREDEIEVGAVVVAHSLNKSEWVPVRSKTMLPPFPAVSSTS